MSSIAKLAKPRANRILGIDSSTTSLAFCIFDEKPIKWGKINFYGATIHDKIIDAHQKVAANKDLLSVDRKSVV